MQNIILWKEIFSSSVICGFALLIIINTVFKATSTPLHSNFHLCSNYLKKHITIQISTGSTAITSGLRDLPSLVPLASSKQNVALTSKFKGTIACMETDIAHLDWNG